MAIMQGLLELGTDEVGAPSDRDEPRQLAHDICEIAPLSRVGDSEQQLHVRRGGENNRYGPIGRARSKRLVATGVGGAAA